MIQIPVFLVILGLSLGVLGARCEKSPERRETQNNQRTWFEQKLKENLIGAFVRSPTEAVLRFKGFCGEAARATRLGDFPVQVGQKFCERPDHHGRMGLQFEAIRGNTLVIRYESQFDHRSFGKNLEETDRGTIEWPAKL